MLKHTNSFLLSDRNGSINTDKVEGLFYNDTRYLSCYDLLWNGKHVFGTVEAKDNIETVTYTFDACLRLTLTRFIYNDCLYISLQLKNLGEDPAEGLLQIKHLEDFKDVFVLRNFRHGKLGDIIESSIKENEFSITYLGSDNIKRNLLFIGDGNVIDNTCIKYNIHLDKDEEISYKQQWIMYEGDEYSKNDEKTLSQEEILSILKEDQKCLEEGSVYSPAIKGLLLQSLKDIYRLKSKINGKAYIAAGIPLFATLFGRDSIISGLQLLNREPAVLKETLEVLADFQGKELNPYLEEEPGKILHELRLGELSNTKQVPFYPYYGSIDSTPLFLIGIAEYYNRTKDKEFLTEILDKAIKALQWLNEYGDRDGDGFVEYIQLSEKGFNNHGWKDSGNSIVHKDGTLAGGTIALAEVQGYVYKAKEEWHKILKESNMTELSKKLKQEADELKYKFNKSFWMGDYFALALDGNKNKVEAVTSNPLHCLFCGIIDEDKVPLVIERAFKSDLFTDYGIRTMSSLEKAYNPLSYHNGSIWPHDNSMIALGLKKLGYNKELEMLANSIFRAGNRMRNLQMPELYGGENLALYETACIPQAWAAGAVILMNDLLVE